MCNEANVSTKRLCVFDICEDHTEVMLRDYFQRYGTVEQVCRSYSFFNCTKVLWIFSVNVDRLDSAYRWR
jgi:hypothetical protein